MINAESRYLILGKNGMLGRAFQDVLHDRDMIAWDRRDLDVTDFGYMERRITEVMPDVLVNCTAYKDTNKAESEEELAKKVNGYAVGVIAKICREHGITLINFSTDYVFDGRNREGYAENAVPKPINAYGRSKLLGEELLIEEMELEREGQEMKEGKYFLVRTAYLFGEHGINIVEKILAQAYAGNDLKGIEDQYSNPTYTIDLAKQVKFLVETNEYEYGIYHVTNSGATNLFEFAKTVLAKAGLANKIEPCSIDDWVAPARRPQYTVLLNTKLPELRSWKEALNEYLNNN